MNYKVLDKLAVTIKERHKKLPEDSYVSNLFKKGKVKIANKFGEEAIETISAFLAEGNDELLEESADLLFHFLILLESSDLKLEQVLNILEERMKND